MQQLRTANPKPHCDRPRAIGYCAHTLLHSGKHGSAAPRTQAREELIRKTIAAVKGAPKVRCDGLAA